MLSVPPAAVYQVLPSFLSTYVCQVLYQVMGGAFQAERAAWVKALRREYEDSKEVPMVEQLVRRRKGWRGGQEG